MRQTTFHYFVILLLLFSFLAGCKPGSSSPEPEPASVSHTFTYSDAPLLNPERGFFTPYELPSPAGFSSVRITGNTLVHLNLRFDNYREADLPESLLNELQTNFDDIRTAGVKAIVRVAYNAGPFPDSQPDASKPQILKHIQQLTPLLRKNSDVIAWLEAGFIGAWGEWHTSTNGLDNIQDKQEILNAILKAIPNRYVQVRYPANIIEMYPNPKDAITAFVAHHNDCFLSSETDVGTYERDGANTIERDQAYLAELTRFTPMSGETCAPFPPRSECANAIQEMKLLHFSAINEAYHKGILRSWEAGGCLQEIADHMGYRLALVTADFNEQVKSGGLLNLKVGITNNGFASLMNPRPLFVVLVAQDGILHYKTKLDLDPRAWQPGAFSFSASIRLPSKMKEGEYALALWLPDEAETLQANPLYAVQFANENVWDESTGYNILGKILVDSSVPGSYKRGNSMKVEAVSSEAASPAPTSTPAPAALDEKISNIEVSNDAETVRFSFDYVSGTYNAFQLFMDTDRDPNTGFNLNEIGADVLIENDSLNLYGGSGTDDWNWTPAETAIAFEDTGSQVIWKIPRPLLNAVHFDAVFQLVDANWDTAYVTQKTSYTLK